LVDGEFNEGGTDVDEIEEEGYGCWVFLVLSSSGRGDQKCMDKGCMVREKMILFLSNISRYALPFVVVQLLFVLVSK